MNRSTATDVTQFDVLVVGAGFAGMYMLHRLRQLGLRAQVLEAGEGVGGTWYWNRYPGARCDIESIDYSFSFNEDLQQEWVWSERYAAQPELLTYAEHIAERFDLKKDIRFGVRVKTAQYNEVSGHWRLTTESATGDAELTSRFCIMATGCLSVPNEPQIEGKDDFAGPVYHTGRWPQKPVDFSGQRVAVIGTGSSGVQTITKIAPEVGQLTVFQRTASYSVPAANHPLSPKEQDKIKADYAALRALSQSTRNGTQYPHNPVSGLAVSDEEREREFQKRWDLGGLSFVGSFMDVMQNDEVNSFARDFVRRKICQTVKDARTAQLLSPKSVLGCKRLCVDTGYYEVFNQTNVELVDISKHGVERFSEKGVIANGQLYEADAIILATGFDAMTGALGRIGIHGRGGRELKEAWSEGPRTYLGLMSAGFPNLFMITAPGSPSVLTNMLTSIQHHVELVCQFLEAVQARQAVSVEAEDAAQEAWVTHVNGVAGNTLFPNCNSWYLGANVPGKPRVFMPYVGYPPYVQACSEVVADGFRGFRFEGTVTS